MSNIPRYIKRGIVKVTADEVTSEDFELAYAPCHAVILHPSLGHPLVVEPQKDITIYVLGHADMVFEYHGFDELAWTPGMPIPKKRQDATQFLKRRIARLLHVFPWARCAGEQAKKYKIRKNDDLHYTTPELVYENIKVKQPYQLTDKKPLVKSASGKHLGLVRQSSRHYYEQAGFEYIFEITLKNLQLGPGLYDANWVIIDDEAHYNFNHEKNNGISPSLCPQDKLIRDALSDSHSLICSYDIDGFDSTKDTFFTPVENSPIQSYHPIYVVDKDALGIGHLTDMHISSRQLALKKSTIQVINDNRLKDISPPLGKQIHDTYSSFKDLLRQMGEDAEVDLLVLTGDFVDFNQNLDPNKVNIAGTNDLWKHLRVKKQHDKKALDKTHTLSIDDVIIFSLFKWYMDTYQKPVVLTSGNHDSYELPFGLSPRFAGKRANDGIPADHNLTIHEACLIGGTGCGDIIKNFNFTPTIAQWFYHVFTPMSDFVIQYKQQQLIGLDWGEDEAFLTNRSIKGTGGFLPQSTETLTDNQLSLLRHQVSDKFKYNMLAMHATVVSYDMKYPITDKGEVPCLGDGTDFNLHACGTFRRKRHEFYKEFIKEKKLSHVFSGHSHRAGVYQCTGVDDRTNHQPTLAVAGFATPPPLMHYNILVQGYDPTTVHCLDTTFKDATRIIVSACAGGISVQNYAGEMAEFNLDLPMGSKVSFKGGKDYFYLVKTDITKVPTAKPKIAAALEQFDLVGPGVIKHFGRHPEHKHLMELVYDEQLPEGMIEGVELILFNAQSQESLRIKPQIKEMSPRRYNVRFDDSIRKEQREFARRGKVIHYLAIHLSHQSLEKLAHFKHYDCTLPWIYPCFIRTDVYSGKIEKIFRDPAHGEIPNFDSYEVVE